MVRNAILYLGAVSESEIDNEMIENKYNGKPTKCSNNCNCPTCENLISGEVNRTLLLLFLMSHLAGFPFKSPQCFVLPTQHASESSLHCCHLIDHSYCFPITAFSNCSL